jgi:sugar phosphate isomerase/epimerase
MFSRREFLGVSLGGFALGVAGASREGVAIGIESFSFRDRPLDQAIHDMREIGFTRCELYFRHVEPVLPRDDLRKWRTSVDLREFETVRKKFDKARIHLDSYYYGLWGDMTDPEIERGFEMAKALGVPRITTSTVLSMMERIDRYATKAKIRVGLHNHSRIRPDQIATPESFDAALKGRSEYIGITLDMGHLAAAGFDAVSFIEQRHERILGLHLKDRKKDDGPDMPFGQGDTPIKEVLLLLRDRNYPIPAYIEYERTDPDVPAEVRKSLEYCRKVLS